MAATELVDSSAKNSSYYRSHLYTSYHGINPLVTAAHPLLSIVDRLQLSRSIDTNSEFYSNLQYELKVFEGRCLAANYEEETVFIAHFLLSACINEILHDRETFSTFKKLMPPTETQEHTPDVQFFEILDKIIDKPDHYLDLLELIYLCLSLGFEGKYRQNEHEKLKGLMETLYHTISSRRQQSQQSLFETSTQKSSAPAVQPKTVHWSIWGLGSLLMMSLLFLGSNWYLDHKAQSFTNSAPSIISE
jgi:type IV/VI secretion system ImpK/VasF family protein